MCGLGPVLPRSNLFSYTKPGFSKSKKGANAIMPASALPKGQRTNYDGKKYKIKIKGKK
jgi:hypothetical protein